MKTFLKIAFITGLIGVCCATQLDEKSAKTFKAERVSGDVRVTLIRADRTTVFSGALSPRASENQDRYASGLSVVYVVEALGTEPVKWEFPQNSSASDRAVFVDGTTMVGKDANSSSCLDHKSFNGSGWLRKPKVSNPERALICEDIWWDAQVRNGKFDLYIRKGFNGKVEEIRFTEVPIE